MPRIKKQMPTCLDCGVELRHKKSIRCGSHAVKHRNSIKPKKQPKQRTTKHKNCVDCGKTISFKATRCGKCAGLAKSNHPSLSLDDRKRIWSQKHKYGMCADEFYIYWVACRGRCWICDKEMKMPEKRRGQGLDVVAIDHDHKTGRIRGLLCNSCNKGIGFLKDDISILKKAIKYLCPEI